MSTDHTPIRGRRRWFWLAWALCVVAGTVVVGFMVYDVVRDVDERTRPVDLDDAPLSTIDLRPEDETTPPPSTFNVFYPEERPLTDCLNNSIPLPNCGSEARGGWAQTTIFVALLGGLGFIGWRISRIVRANRRTLDASTAGSEPSQRTG